jgi:hypothetical protein
MRKTLYYCVSLQYIPTSCSTFNLPAQRNLSELLCEPHLSCGSRVNNSDNKTCLCSSGRLIGNRIWVDWIRYLKRIVPDETWTSVSCLLNRLVLYVASEVTDALFISPLAVPWRLLLGEWRILLLSRGKCSVFLMAVRIPLLRRMLPDNLGVLSSPMRQFEWPRNVCHVIEFHGVASGRFSLGYCAV